MRQREGSKITLFDLIVSCDLYETRFMDSKKVLELFLSDVLTSQSKMNDHRWLSIVTENNGIRSSDSEQQKLLTLMVNLDFYTTEKKIPLQDCIGTRVHKYRF